MAGHIGLLTNHNNKILPGLVTRPFRELLFEGLANGSVLPQKPTLKISDRYVTQVEVDYAGGASETQSDYSNDIPLVDVSAGEVIYKVAPIKQGFYYTLEEMEGVKNGSFNLTDQRGKVCRRLVAERSNRRGAFGSNRLGYSGMMNNTNVETVDSTFDFFTATAEDIAGFFSEHISAIRRNTKQIHRVDTILLPPEHYNFMMLSIIPGTGRSVLSFLEETFKSDNNNISLRAITECEAESLELNGVQPDGTAKGRIVFYTKDEELLCRCISPVKKMPEEYTNGKYITTLIQVTSEVMIHYPNSMRYVDVPMRP